MTFQSTLSIAITLLLAAVVSGAVLIVAVRIFNGLTSAGKKGNQISAPNFGWGVTIGMVSTIANYSVASILDWIAWVPDPGELGRTLGTIVFALISLAITSLVLSLMLKIRYTRAIGVSLCWVLAMFVIFFVVNLALFAFALIAPGSE